MTPLARGPGHDSPGRAGQPRGPSDTGQSALDSRSTPRGLGPGPWSPGTSVQNRGASDLVQNRPRLLVDSAGPQARARSPGTDIRHPGPRSLSESPWKAGGHCGPSGTALRRPGRLVDTAGLPTMYRVSRERWSTTRALGNGPESLGKAGRLLRYWDPGLSPPGQLVETRALGHECDSPGRAGRPRGHLFLGPNHPGELVDTTGLRTQGRVARDSWSTSFALGPGSK